MLSGTLRQGISRTLLRYKSTKGLRTVPGVLGITGPLRLHCERNALVPNAALQSDRPAAPTVSVVIPAMNEAENLPTSCPGSPPGSTS